MDIKQTPIIDVKIEDDIVRTFILFMQTADIVKKYADARLYKEGLSVIKIIVLKVLDVNGGTMIPSDIARWTFRERHDITTLVDRLKKDGLVSTKRSHKDRRYINVTLTDKGREALGRGMPVAQEITSQVMQSIDKGAAGAIEDSMRTMRQNGHDGLGNIGKKP